MESLRNTLYNEESTVVPVLFTMNSLQKYQYFLQMKSLPQYQYFLQIKSLPEYQYSTLYTVMKSLLYIVPVLFTMNSLQKYLSKDVSFFTHYYSHNVYSEKSKFKFRS
jgi:hypothetical protein